MSEPMVTDEDDGLVPSQTIDVYNLAEIEIPEPAQVAVCDNIEGRLMISHITNIDFKSYAGTKILGPFQKSFTCIVGPNGSGKSNVIDAMLFVFGFRASKIRSKKLSVLIHNSERHQNINSCTVKVHFQRIKDTGPDDDDFEVIAGSEFTVSRTASKDNTSSYYIDDKKASAKEVVKLLLSHGIDLDHNRFLILQGEVELISMMKPKAPSEHEEGMLEYLEDIIGSNRFKQPLELLSSRIDRINELRSEKLSRVKLAEKEMNLLEGPKNEAIKYLTIENEVTVSKNSWYHVNKFQAEQSLDVANEKMATVRETASSVTKEMSKLDNEKAEHKKANKKVYKDFEKLKNACEEKKAAVSETNTKATKASEDLKHLNTKIKKLEKNLETERKKVADLKSAPEKHQTEIEELQEDQGGIIHKKEMAEKKMTKVMENIKTETEELQEKKRKLEEQLLKNQEELNDKRSKAEVAKAELDLANSGYEKEQKILQGMMDSYQKAKHGIQENESTVEELKEKIPETETELKQITDGIAKLTGKEEELGNKLNELRVKLRDYSSQLNTRQRQSAQLQALMDQKASGRLPGIVGRLGDLGAIDSKYDVAISTACGALDNIVVDTMETGQQCVEYLKKANLGVCTFILLDKMDQWTDKADRCNKTPENAPRLFDLVKYEDSRLKGAFYFALRDTLVADNLEHASRLAFGKTRFRVVTLQGQTIEISGAMSGGGRPLKGRMGASVRSQTISTEKLAEQEEKYKKGTELQESQRVKKANLVTQQERMTRDLNTMRNSLEKCSMELKMYKEQEVTLKKEIKAQQKIAKDATPDINIIDKLELNFKKHDDEFQAINGKVSVISEKSQALHKMIIDLSEKKMKSAQADVDKATKELNANRDKINRLTVAIKSNSRNLKRAEEKETSLGYELEDCVKEKEDLEGKQLSKLKGMSEKLLEEYNENLEKCKEVEDQVHLMNKRIDAIEEEQNELKKSMMENRRNVEKYEAAVNECESKLDHWVNELSKLSLRSIPGDKETAQLITLSSEDIENHDVKFLQAQVAKGEDQLKKLNPHTAALAEFRKKEEQYIERVDELQKVTDVRNQQRQLFYEMKKRRLDEFTSGFSVITDKLKEMYQMITLGGDAELELVDTLDPFSEGIVFSVRPPKKSWKNITNLSGGEKTLSSLALVFALHHYRPTPLYVMDEIDAALDFKNVSIVANYIKERTKNAQFVIISLRDQMFEQATRLVGVYKTHDATKTAVISVKDGGFVTTVSQ